MRRIFMICLLTSLFLVVLPIIAQEDFDELYEWEEEGVTIAYPDDFEPIEDGSFVRFQSDETDFTIIFESYDVDDSLEEYVEDAFEEFQFDDSARFDEDDVFTDDLGDFEMIAEYYYTDEFDDEEFEVGIVAIPLNEDLIAIAIIVPLNDDRIGELNLVLDILSTLTVLERSSSGEVYEFDNGLEIVIDGDWEEEDDLFTNGDVEIEFVFIEIGDEREDTRASGLRDTLANSSDVAYDEDILELIDLDNDADALAYVFEDDFLGLIIAFSPSNDFIVVAIALPIDEDDTEMVLDIVEDILSFVGTMD